MLFKISSLWDSVSVNDTIAFLNSELARMLSISQAKQGSMTNGSFEDDILESWACLSFLCIYIEIVE